MLFRQFQSPHFPLFSIPRKQSLLRTCRPCASALCVLAVVDVLEGASPGEDDSQHVPFCFFVWYVKPLIG